MHIVTYYTLVGVDGNAWSIISYVVRAMRDCKKTKEDIESYTNNATSSDYQHLLSVSQDMLRELNKVCCNYYNNIK